VDVVGPGDGGEGGWEVVLFVAGEDEDRNHLEVWYRGLFEEAGEWAKGVMGLFMSWDNLPGAGRGGR
jgi:hypothetical protein